MSDVFNKNGSYVCARARGNGKSSLSSLKLMEYSTYRDTYLLELSEEDLSRFTHEYFNRPYGFMFSSFLSIGNRVFGYDFYDHEVIEITDGFSTGIDFCRSSYFEKYVNFIADKQAFKTSYHEIKESIWTLHNLFYMRAMPYASTYWKSLSVRATVKVIAGDKDGLHEVKCSISPYKSWHEYFEKDKSKYF